MTPSAIKVDERTPRLGLRVFYCARSTGTKIQLVHMLLKTFNIFNSFQSVCLLQLFHRNWLSQQNSANLHFDVDLHKLVTASETAAAVVVVLVHASVSKAPVSAGLRACGAFTYSAEHLSNYFEHVSCEKTTVLMLLSSIL